MTSTLASTMIRATLGATLLLSSVTIAAGCGKPDETAQGLGASLAVAPKPSPKSPTLEATPVATPQVVLKGQPKKIDMSYIFKGTDADRQKLKLAGFKPGMTKEAKLATVKGINAVVERMQADYEKDPGLEVPRAVRDGARVWNGLAHLEKLKLLEENPAPNPEGEVSNWAAAAVGIAVAALAYEVAKDEKWINDLELKQLQIRTFTAQQLDHAATLGNSPLELPAHQGFNTH